jgi:NAD(P)-dependent dehydrogenase (short-subunit alcohol dehydrogenase family)
MSHHPIVDAAPGAPAPAAALRPVVLVTGAARRLGRAIALHLAAHGWDIALHHRGHAAAARDTAAELQALGARVALLPADLADEAACRALLPAAAAALGPVTGVVHSAAVFEHDSAATFTTAALEHHLRVNTVPGVLLAQALHDGLPGGARGTVVHLLDQKLFNPNPDHFSYTLSKAALQMATTLLAQALAPRVRVNAVAPGLTLGSDDIDAQRLAALQAATPLQRGVQPEDVAAAVRLLLENPAVTGSTLLVDAGSHLAPMARDFAFHQP